MTLFLILASIFAEKKAKIVCLLHNKSAYRVDRCEHLQIFPENPDLCLFQDIRPLKLDVNMNDILQFVLVPIFYEGQVFSEFPYKS